MKLTGTLGTVIINVIILVVMIGTAFIAAGIVHDRVVPEQPTFSVALEAIQTNGLGGTVEHDPLVHQVVQGVFYDIGVRLIALDEDENVRVYFSLDRSNISADDVDAYYYDTVSSTWRQLSFADQGNSLKALLGPVGGLDIEPGDETLYRLLISFNFDGNVTPSCSASS
ncbi:MAG: hypothetical protein LUQ09_08560 [Methanomassiliicoccales archaeon]|nr:hypothetical protein [Methanomassiliicoccales archaeon]